MGLWGGGDFGGGFLGELSSGKLRHLLLGGVYAVDFVSRKEEDILRNSKLMGLRFLVYTEFLDRWGSSPWPPKVFTHF